MAVYAPEDNYDDANDGMALTLGGTRRWPKAKALASLGQLCGVLPKQQAVWHERLADALLSTAAAVLAFEKRHYAYGFGTQGARMLALWSHGVHSLNPEAATKLMAYSEAVADIRPTSGKT